jgi:hypothetical protein
MWDESSSAAVQRVAWPPRETAVALNFAWMWFVRTNSGLMSEQAHMEHRGALETRVIQGGELHRFLHRRRVLDSSTPQYASEQAQG